MSDSPSSQPLQVIRWLPNWSLRFAQQRRIITALPHSLETDLERDLWLLWEEVSWTLSGYSIQHFLVFSVWCAIFSVQCSVFSVLCSVFSVQCAVYSVHCAVFIMKCSVFSVQYAVFSVKCSICSVRCTLLSVQRLLFAMDSEQGSGFSMQCAVCIFAVYSAPCAVFSMHCSVCSD